MNNLSVEKTITTVKRSLAYKKFFSFNITPATPNIKKYRCNKFSNKIIIRIITKKHKTKYKCKYSYCIKHNFIRCYFSFIKKKQNIDTKSKNKNT